MTAKRRNPGALDHNDEGSHVLAGQIHFLATPGEAIIYEDPSHVSVTDYIRNSDKWGRKASN